MCRPVRMSMLAMSVVLVLLTMQIGVEAKKKNSKRKKTAQSAPVIAPSAPATPVSRGAVGIESVGDGDTSRKRLRDRITIQPPPPSADAGSLIISEFRVRGPNGANDEFIEIYNDNGANHTVAAISGTGYAVAASDGNVRCSIPNGTIIPARGHYLCTNSVGYSLGSYPAGNGTTATGDATYLTDIPDNAGIALFNNNTGGGSFTCRAVSTARYTATSACFTMLVSTLSGATWR